jgi:general secretion pathway protein H
LSTCRNSGGFTLIELVVALVVIGVVASITVLSLGINGSGRPLAKETGRFIDTAHRSADVAMFSGVPVSLLLTSSGYHTVKGGDSDRRRSGNRPKDGEWHELGKVFRLSIADGMGGWIEQPSKAIVFDELGLATPVIVRLLDTGTGQASYIRIGADGRIAGGDEVPGPSL